MTYARDAEMNLGKGLRLPLCCSGQYIKEDLAAGKKQAKAQGIQSSRTMAMQ